VIFWFRTSIVPNLRTIELFVKRPYNSKRETAIPSFDRRRDRGNDPACAFRSGARGDLCGYRRFRMFAKLLEFSAHQRKGRSQVHVVAAFQVVTRGRFDSRRTSRRRNAQYLPERRTGEAVSRIDPGHYPCSQSAGRGQGAHRHLTKQEIRRRVGAETIGAPRRSRRGVSQVALEKCEQVGLGHSSHLLGDEHSLFE
jgi:hypothetical protein